MDEVSADEASDNWERITYKVRAMKFKYQLHVHSSYRAVNATCNF